MLTYNGSQLLLGLHYNNGLGGALLPVSFALYLLFNAKTDVQWMGQQVKLVYFNRVDRVELVHLHDYHELRRGDKPRAS